MNIKRITPKYNFHLVYKDQPELTDSIYWKSKSEKDELPSASLKFHNNSSGSITLKKVADDKATENHYHFYIRLGKNELSRPLSDIQLNPDSDWSIYTPDKSIGGKSVSSYQWIYFLWKGNKDRTIEKDEILICNVGKLIAKGDLYYNGTELAFQFTLDKELVTPTWKTDEVDAYPIQLLIEQWGTKRQIPLAAQWLGKSSLLNDNITSNALTLRLFNSDKNATLTFTPDSEIFISVLAGSTAYDLETDDKIKGIVIALCDTEQAEHWKLSHTGFVDSSVTLRPYRINQYIMPGKYLDIQLNKIITGNPAGITNVQIHYKKVPGYPDGQFMVPLMKSPFQVTNQQTLFNTDIAVSGKVKEFCNGDYYDLVPRGTVLMWYSNGKPLPKGWKLCDGKSHQSLDSDGSSTLIPTPNLLGRFVVAASTSDAVNEDHQYYEEGDQGGLNNVQLEKRHMPKHSHGVTDNGHSHVVTDAGHTHTAIDNGHNHLLPKMRDSKTDADDNSLEVYARDSTDMGYYTYTAYADISIDKVTSNISLGSSNSKISINSEGEGYSHENRPPYYALYYIMKL